MAHCVERIHGLVWNKWKEN